MFVDINIPCQYGNLIYKIKYKAQATKNNYIATFNFSQLNLRLLVPDKSIDLCLHYRTGQ